MAETLLPHDREAEQGVLGAVLHDNAALLRVAGSLTPDHFFSPAHRDIFAVMLEMSQDQWPIDEVTLAHVLRNRDRLEQVGGIVYIVELQDVAPVAANILAYAEIVHEKWQRRQVIVTAIEISKAGLEDYKVGTESLIVQAQTRFERILATSLNLSGATEAEAIQRWTKMYETPTEERSSVYTGTFLDHYIGRLSTSRCTVIAARPGGGKTALMMQMTRNIPLIERRPTLRFNLEMEESEIIERDLSAEGDIDSKLLRDPQQDLLDADKWDRLATAAHKLSNAPLWVYTPEHGPLSVAKIEAISRYHIAVHKIEVIVVDQLSKIVSGVRGTERDKMSARMQGLTRLIKKLKIPIVVACQLRRSDNEEKKPTLVDLKETGTIEEDAHAVILVHTPPPPDGTNERNMRLRRMWNEWRWANILIPKNGGGGTGQFWVPYLPRRTRFDFEHAEANDGKMMGEPTEFTQTTGQE